MGQVLGLSSEKAGEAPEEQRADDTELPPPPPAEGSEETPKAEDDAWKEDYEDLVEPEPVKKRKRAPFHHWGSVIVLVIVLIVLIAWTVLSPSVMEPVGDTYVVSDVYAGWGNYTGVRDIWSGNVTWGVSIRGLNTSDDNRSIELKVLVTKVAETTGNSFLLGTSIEMRNVSAYDENGTFLGAMIGHADIGYGAEATVPISFEESGTYLIFVKVKFLVYEVMRIGYLPLETVQIEKAWVDFPIVVS
jgi:hypothetical protein